jgi:hypothetical protein
LKEEKLERNENTDVRVKDYDGNEGGGEVVVMR